MGSFNPPRLTAQLCASSPLNLSHSSTFNLSTKEPGLSRRVLLYPSGVACFSILQIIKRQIFKPFCRYFCLKPGGDEGTRTPDFRLAKAALSQLSYIPNYVSCAHVTPDTGNALCGPEWIRTTDPCVISTVL
jgi:hypothetical protein